MIYSLTGVIAEKTPSEVVIQCGGVGYLVSMPLSAAGAIPPVGSEGTIYTHFHVTEKEVSLFGFADRESREMFRLLTTVSGVGPKAGLSILSALSPDKIVLAVSAGDHKAFTVASGVGPKLGQRLVLELKDKVKGHISSGGLSMDDISTAASAESGAASQAIAALVSLGYTQSEAAASVTKIDPGMPVAEIIRLALQGMGKGR